MVSIDSIDSMDSTDMETGASGESDGESANTIASTLSALTDSALSIEKARVRAQIRQSHLERSGRNDPETDEVVQILEAVETYIDGRVAKHLKSHPAHPWFSRVKGVGGENIAKVLSPIRIDKAPTISALWRFAGMDVEDGHAPHKVRGGGKLHYCSELRVMLYRLGGAIMKAGIRKQCSTCGKLLGDGAIAGDGKSKTPHACKDALYPVVGTTKFAQYYLEQKGHYQARFTAADRKIVPATELPVVMVEGKKKRVETAEYISEGHVHAMALRKMLKLFLACLYLVWREAEGLPVRAPYAIEQLQHQHYIDPWSMVDR